VALGGGALERPAHRRWVRGSGVVAWLRVAPETAAARLARAPGKRPRWPGTEDPLAEARHLLARRRAEWQESADFAVEADGPLEAVAARVLALWKEAQSRAPGADPNSGRS
jgi:shikimate kinase